MQKVTFYCDRCGREIKEPYKIIGHKIDKNTGDYLTDEGGHLDFCRRCFETIMSGITDNISEDLEEVEEDDELPFCDPVDDQEEELDEDLETPEETGKKLRKKCDVGKMKALREAGWSLQKIADDMGCTAPTVSKWLKKEGIR